LAFLSNGRTPEVQFPRRHLLRLSAPTGAARPIARPGTRRTGAKGRSQRVTWGPGRGCAESTSAHRNGDVPDREGPIPTRRQDPDSNYSMNPSSRSRRSLAYSRERRRTARRRSGTGRASRRRLTTLRASPPPRNPTLPRRGPRPRAGAPRALGRAPHGVSISNRGCATPSERGAGPRKERCLRDFCESGMARPLMPAITLTTGKIHRIGPKAYFPMNKGRLFIQREQGTPLYTKGRGILLSVPAQNAQ
jgi:hypothetical protein